jgi:hypothetical protein
MSQTMVTVAMDAAGFLERQPATAGGVVQNTTNTA